MAQNTYGGVRSLDGMSGILRKLLTASPTIDAMSVPFVELSYAVLFLRCFIKMEITPCQFILYACPTGTLGQQIAHYFQESRQRWGENKAHHYMPHCTLTGFFHDQQQAIALYLQAIEAVLQDRPKDIPKDMLKDIPKDMPKTPSDYHSATALDIRVTGMVFKDKWHGLTLESPGLQAITQAFAQRAKSPTRTDDLRLKTWLHVSLAYGFEPSHADGLKQLALEQVDPNADVGWEIRFYQRSPINEWTCHGLWTI